MYSTINAPSYTALVGIVLRDLEFVKESKFLTKTFAIALLEEMSEKLDALNEASKEENTTELKNGKVEIHSVVEVV